MASVSDPIEGWIALSIDKHVKSAFEGAVQKVLEDGSARQAGEEDEEWAEAHVLRIAWDEVSGPAERKIGEVLFQVNVFSRFAQHRTDRNRSRVFFMASIVRGAFASQDLPLFALGPGQSAQQCGAINCDGGVLQRMPDNPSKPAILGCALTFTAVVHNHFTG